MEEMPTNIKIARAYYEKGTKFAEYTFINNVLTDTRYFKIENGQAFPCDPPDDDKKLMMSINLDDLENQHKLEIRDQTTGELVSAMDKVEKLPIVDDIVLMIRSVDKENWEKTIEPIESFSDKEREKIKNSVFPATQDDGTLSPSIVQMDEVKRAVEVILSEQKSQILPQFYKNIDPSQEFGVSRFLADRMAYLTRLLGETVLTNIQDSTYLVSAEMKDSSGNSIKLEHRFKATTDEEAGKLYQKISSQLAGIQQKIWLACWRLANELHQYIFTCQLTDIMTITYPDREGYFSVPAKTEFFEHLKSLEQTKILFSIPAKKKKNAKKILMKTFEIPLLEIKGKLGGEEDKYPQQVTISIMNLLPNPGKMAFVGAPFRNETLELHADNTSLAAWIQIRKSQAKDKSTLLVERDFLIKLAGLQKTDESNRTVANKKLLEKLARLHEKGILKSIPSSIERMVPLEVR